MTSAPIRFLSALFWPLTIWPSLLHLKEHPADEYVGRTSPIIAFAIGFWICVGALIALWLAIQNRTMRVGGASDVDFALRTINPGLPPLFSVLMFLAPLLYVVGFWLYTARSEHFSR